MLLATGLAAALATGLTATFLATGAAFAATFFATGFATTLTGAAFFAEAAGLAAGLADLTAGTDLTAFAGAGFATGLFTTFFATALGDAPFLTVLLAVSGFLEAGFRALAFTVCLLAGLCRTGVCEGWNPVAPTKRRRRHSLGLARGIVATNAGIIYQLFECRSVYQIRDCSRPCTKMSFGKSMPMNTILLTRSSPSAHSGPRSLPINWCTPWKITLRSVPFILSTPL